MVPQLLNIGRAVIPSDIGWSEAKQGFALHVDYETGELQGVVFAQSPEDVLLAIQICLKENIQFRMRSGRHNYEAFSSIVNGVVIDVSELNSIQINRTDDTAWIGAGCFMLELSERLGALGYTIPMATGPSVGIGGLTLGGGFGVVSRKWGLTSDNVVAIEIVDASGILRVIDQANDPDLFWAMRGGGGGNFAAVTRFQFALKKVDLVTVFSLTYEWDSFVEVVDAWQRWHSSLPDGYSTFIALLTGKPGRLVLSGQFTPDSPAELPRVGADLGPMLALGPSGVNIQTAPNVVANRITFGVDPMNPEWRVDSHSDDQIFKSTSTFAFDFFPIVAIKKMKRKLELVPDLSAAPSQPSMVQLLGGGGAIISNPGSNNSVTHREAKFAVQYDAYWTANQDTKRMMKWVKRFRAIMGPWTQGAYVNYADTLLINPMDQYYDQNLARLSSIRLTVDPNHVFNYPLAIP